MVLMCIFIMVSFYVLKLPNNSVRKIPWSYPCQGILFVNINNRSFVFICVKFFSLRHNRNNAMMYMRDNRRTMA